MAPTDLRVIVSTPLEPRVAPGSGSQPATVTTSDGHAISAAVAQVTVVGSAWSATLRQLSRPGAMASAYFGDGLRSVIVRFEDGCSAAGRVASTNFSSGGERLYRVEGVGSLPEFP